MTDYEKFLESKRLSVPDAGIEVEPGKLNPMLFDFQRDIIAWALRKGRAAIFADCGLGKTAMELEFANHIPGRSLIVAPLAVGMQTEREGEKFGVDCRYIREDDESVRIAITNYEILERFNPEAFDCVILDESSILKSYDGKTRQMIIDQWMVPRYRLAATATPAPNDFMELGNHSEFLGQLTRAEMLSMFFVHDGGETQKWRLKGHALDEFWEWVCSWGVMINKPADLGYEQDGFDLPPVSIQSEVVQINGNGSGDYLFPMQAMTLSDRIRERSNTTEERAKRVEELVSNIREYPILIWCGLNKEADAVCSRLRSFATEIRGSDPPRVKEERLRAFSDGEIPILVTKPSIAGFGLNWQHCRNVIYLGLSDSYEQFYQSLRRCWRFGQQKEVNAWIVTAETEGEVLRNVLRKEQDAIHMREQMVENTKEILKGEIMRKNGKMKTFEGSAETVKEFEYLIRRGDCVQLMDDIETDSIGYSIFSPPFSSLYTYSDKIEDMGNARSDEEFFQHFGFLAEKILRVTLPGRCCSIHCMDLPTSKAHNGYIGLRDFSGEIIRAMESCGWIYHSKVTIWKDPVTAMQRTKALGLLHKQIVKDSAMCRQGVPDYLVTFRKPGENPERVSGELDYYVGDPDTLVRSGRLSIDIWQRYASPVWMDIRQSNTLQKESAREERDERHICPLQLDVIERGLQLWSLEGDTVLSPFAGIGSEGFVAIKTGRKFIGFELKESYFRQMELNLKRAAQESISEFDFGQVSATV